MMGHLAAQVLGSEQEESDPLSKKDMATENPTRGNSLGPHHSKQEKRQITRSRTSYSCQTCRRRKVKCDREHPVCGGCRRAHEECVYGKEDPHTAPRGNEDTASGFIHGSKRKPSFDTPFEPSPPHSDLVNDTDSRATSLEAVEQQLARLTSLIENIRRDAAPGVPANGPLTPISSRSQRDGDEGHSSRNGRSESPTRQNTRSSSETKDLGAGQEPSKQTMKNRFWSAMWEELEQLQSTVQGFGEIPTALVSTANECGAARCARSDGSTPHVKDRVDGTISFHKSAHGHISLRAHEACQLCSRISVDKSVFLLGPSSKGSETMTRPDPNDTIPTEAQSNVLFRSWLSGVNPALPILPLPQVFRRYHTFWQWKRQNEAYPDTRADNPDVNFMSLLYTIWYAGSLSISSRGLQRWFPRTSRAKICSHFHDQAVRHLSFQSFPTPAPLPALDCFVMLQSLPSAEEETLQGSAYLNLIVRAAQAAGLHRESPPQAPTRDTEMLRRIWWQILQLDTSMAIASGHPAFISEGLFNTHMISEIKEAFIGSAEAIKYEEAVAAGVRRADAIEEPFSGKNPSIVSVVPLVAKGASIVASALGKVIRIHQGTKLITKDDLGCMNVVIDDAETQVKAMIDRIPTQGVPELGFTPDQYSSYSFSQQDVDPALGEAPLGAELDFHSGAPAPDLPSALIRYYRQKVCSYHKWARITLSLMCDKLHCVAYAPFLKNARSRLWSAGRQCALHHCHSFMRKFISLATDPSLEPFRWSWPGMHQPMHAAMIILVDVYERPDSVEAPRSRALIDKVFSLSDAAAGIVGGENGVSAQRPLHEGGSEAWDMLRDLRDTAWRTAGMDPDLLWTEDDQVLAGVARPLTAEQKIAQSIREDTFHDDSKSRSEGSTQSHTGSYEASRYLLQLSGRASATEGAPEAGTIVKNQLWSRDKPSAQHLARLDGQQKMPFPFTGQVSRCPRSLAPDIRPVDNPSAPIPSQKTVVPAAETRQSHLSMMSKPIVKLSPQFNHPNSICADQNVESQPDMNGTADSRPADQHGMQINGDGVSFAPQPQADGLQDSSLPEITGGVKASSQTTEQNLGFDWERWDAVFGQYAGFTELMEDVTWIGNEM